MDYTPIMTACTRINDIPAVNLINFILSMIKHGADINARDKEGLNAMEILITSFCWRDSDDDDLSDLLMVCYHMLVKDIKVNLITIIRLFEEEKFLDYQMISFLRKFIIMSRVDVREADAMGETVLHKATKRFTQANGYHNMKLWLSMCNLLVNLGSQLFYQSDNKGVSPRDIVMRWFLRRITWNYQSYQLVPNNDNKVKIPKDFRFRVPRVMDNEDYMRLLKREFLERNEIFMARIVDDLMKTVTWRRRPSSLEEAKRRRIMHD